MAGTGVNKGPTTRPDESSSDRRREEALAVAAPPAAWFVDDAGGRGMCCVFLFAGVFWVKDHHMQRERERSLGILRFNSKLFHVGLAPAFPGCHGAEDVGKRYLPS